jgi:hypothetical protein
MQTVTLVGLRPRAVGSSIENLYGGSLGVASGSTQQRLPSLANTSASSKPAVSALVSQSEVAVAHGTSTTGEGIHVQQLYDESIGSKAAPRIEGTKKQRGDVSDDDNEQEMSSPAVVRLQTKLPAIQAVVSSAGSNTTTGYKVESALASKRMAASLALPMSPETAMKLYMHKLSAFEQHEIFDYQKVFKISYHETSCYMSLPVFLLIFVFNMILFMCFITYCRPVRYSVLFFIILCLYCCIQT